jgi:hypothetical protein
MRSIAVAAIALLTATSAQAWENPHTADPRYSEAQQHPYDREALTRTLGKAQQEHPYDRETVLRALGAKDPWASYGWGYHPAAPSYVAPSYVGPSYVTPNYGTPNYGMAPVPDLPNPYHNNFGGGFSSGFQKYDAY